MQYSFKKHINNEYYLYLLFLLGIICMIIYIMCTLPIIIKVKSVNFIILKHFIAHPIISVISFIILLIRVFSVKIFLRYCIEIDAKIEKCLFYFGSRNWSRQEGTETGVRITLSYKYNNIEYKKGYSLAKNKYTMKYFNKYKEVGNIVKILISDNNPKKIMLKEIFDGI